MAVFGPYRGIVDLAHDGDTVNVRLDVGFDLTVNARIRVLGINAPELATAEGKAARDYAQALLPPGTEVSVVSHGWDKYGGRVDGDILFGAAFGTSTEPRSFAAEMLASGHAKRWDGTGQRPT